MTGHFKCICVKCNIVTSQCRCMDCDKVIYHDICPACLQKAEFEQNLSFIQSELDRMVE